MQNLRKGTKPNLHNYDNLGQVFKNLRTNRRISLKQISNERVSTAQISRFERGESDSSLEKYSDRVGTLRCGTGYNHSFCSAWGSGSGHCIRKSDF